jgi:hypothetical protein
MKKPPSGSDRIVLSLVIVLGIIVLGVVVTIIIEALNPAEMSEIGQQVSVFFATVGGAIVGVAGGYVTHTAPQIPPAPEFPEVTVDAPTVVSDDAETPAPAPLESEESSDTALVAEPVDTPSVTYDSGSESYGGPSAIYEDVTAEFLDEEN